MSVSSMHIALTVLIDSALVRLELFLLVAFLHFQCLRPLAVVTNWNSIILFGGGVAIATSSFRYVSGPRGEISNYNVERLVWTGFRDPFGSERAAVLRDIARGRDCQARSKRCNEKSCLLNRGSNHCRDVCTGISQSSVCSDSCPFFQRYFVVVLFDIISTHGIYRFVI